MPKKRTGIVCLLLAVVAGALVAPAEAAEKSRVPLERRPFTVVALVDSGINPYHVDFRAPELNRHPSTYISGFPRDAKALNLSLDAPDYNAAVARDEGKWGAVKRDDLYWVPGTNIIGAIGPFGGTEPNFLDQNAHGTITASLAGGRVHGPGTNDIVIVVIKAGPETDNTWVEGLEWAAAQPWIDVISNSWSVIPLAEEGNQRNAQASRAAVASGKLVCFSSGNEGVPLWMAGTQGPSWNLNVGASSEKSRGEHVYTNWPNDVLGASGVQAARYQSMDQEGGPYIGTSMSAPVVCGQAARVISEVRRSLGDHEEGPQMGLARGRKQKGPYLEDGCLDRVELEDAIQASAVPAQTAPPDPADPFGIPAAPVAGFVRGGYGIVDGETASVAIDVLLGRAPRPERMIEDEWIARTDSIRDEKWGPAPKPTGCR